MKRGTRSAPMRPRSSLGVKLTRPLLPLLVICVWATTASGCDDESGAGEDLGGDATSDAADDAPNEDDTSPDELPLVELADFEYVGAFRLPADTFGESDMNYSQGPLEYDATHHSIFIVGHTYQQAIAEFAVPALVDSDEVGDLIIADPPLQVFASVLDRTGSNPQSIDRIGGMEYVVGPGGAELLVNAYEYYDAPGDDSHTTLVVRDPYDLAGSRVDGFFELQGRAHAAGWISPIPEAWQDALGGAFIAGSSSGMPIISRLSVGPSAFVFDPFEIVGTDASSGSVATEALLDFSLDHPLDADLSNDSRTNDVWTHLSRAIYGFIPPGTRTYVTLGHSGGHASGVCYKCTPTNGTEACGGYCANDVDDYYHYYWLWDVDDLVAVRNGIMNPYDVRPYAYGEFPTPFETNELGGGTYDPSTGLLYLTVQRADREQGEYANPPVIVAYRLQ